jgi:hypothetical protein
MKRMERNKFFSFLIETIVERNKLKLSQFDMQRELQRNWLINCKIKATPRSNA